MARRPRRNHSAAFKAKVASAALKGDRTMSGLGRRFDLHPNQIKQWKDQLQENAQGVFEGVFEGGAKAETPRPADVKDLHAKIGQLTLENDFLSGARDKAGPSPSARR